MRNQFVVLTLLLAVFVGSCKKTNESYSAQKEKMSFSDLAKLPPPENLDSIRSFAYQTHNEYLSSALIAYNSGYLSLDNSVTNVNNQLDWTKNYFLEIDSPSTSALWEVTPSIVISDYNSDSLAVMLHLNRFENSTNNLYKTYLQGIVDDIRAFVNGDETIDIAIKCSQTFNTMKSDINLDDESKQKLATIIGVIEGSWYYWNAEVDNWSFVTDFPNISDYGFKTTSQKAKKVGLFLAADAMGAIEGAAWGTAAGPVVGTVAGAVCIGALYSGFAAWAW